MHAYLYRFISLYLLLFAITTAHPVTFVDVTDEVGIRFQHSSGTRSSLLVEDMGSGAGFADIDNDGDIDLYIVNIPGPFRIEAAEHTPEAHLPRTTAPAINALYRNNGDGTFTDITRLAGVGHSGYGMGCVFADYDADGNVDLYVTNYGENVLYRNNGDGTFTDVTKHAGVGCELWSTGAVFADYDGDNDLDLYVCNYVTYDLKKFEQEKAESLQAGKMVPNALNPTVFEPQDNVLYRNNGDGTFTDATTETGTAAPGGRSMQAIFSDFDNDNDMDLYVANDTTENHIYQNEGDGTFTDVSADSWAANPHGSMGLAAGDYDADGDIDLFISHWIEQENTLYRNLLKEGGNPIQTGGGANLKQTPPETKKQLRFVDETYSTLLAEVSIKDIGWGTALFDYDNDGDLDIFVANGSTFQELDRPEVLIPQPNRLFRNEADNIFTDVSQDVGIAKLPSRVSRGTAFGDYDNDGDIDIFIVNNYAKPTLLRNETISAQNGNGNNWLRVKLVGTSGNIEAIGAKIQLKAADLTQLREIYAGDSYMSANSVYVQFGLGRAKLIQLLQITWPSGGVQTVHNIPINQQIEITQE